MKLKWKIKRAACGVLAALTVGLTAGCSPDIETKSDKDENDKQYEDVIDTTTPTPKPETPTPTPNPETPTVQSSDKKDEKGIQGGSSVSTGNPSDSDTQKSAQTSSEDAPVEMASPSSQKKEDTPQNVSQEPTKETEAPVVPKAPSQKATKWMPLNDEQEYRVLPDGTIETRNHTLREKKLGEKKVKYLKSDEEGKHKVIRELECETCGHTVFEVTIGDCTYEVTGRDASKEYVVCSDCGTRTTRKHVLKEIKKNSDGGIVYGCTNPGCNYTKTIGGQTHGSISGGGSSSGSNSSKPEHKEHSFVVESWTALIENLKCAICGKTANRNHSFDEGVLNADGSTTYSCTNPGCDYVKTLTPDPIDHKHTLGDPKAVVNKLGNGKHRIDMVQMCTASDCDKSEGYLEIVYGQEVNCTFENGVISKDPTTGKDIITYTCPICGQTKVEDYTKPPIGCNHAFENKSSVTPNNNGTHDVKTWEECSKCHETKNPNTVTQDCNGAQTPTYTDNGNGSHTKHTVYDCDICNTKYTKEEIDNCSGLSSTIEYTNKNDDTHTPVKVTSGSCPDCNHDFTGRVELDPEAHTWGEPDANGDKTCTVCGYVLTHKQEHTCTDFGQESVRYENTGNGHTEIRYKVCLDPNCGKETIISSKEIGHNTIEVEEGYNVYDQCTIPGCNYKELKHTCTEKEVTYGRDDTYCGYVEIVCGDCGKVLVPKHGTTTHSFSDTGNKSSTTKEQACSGCGLTKWVEMSMEEIIAGLKPPVETPVVPPVVNPNEPNVPVEGENQGQNPKPEGDKTTETENQEGVENKDNQPAEGSGENAPVEGENPEQGSSKTPETGVQEGTEGKDNKPAEGDGENAPVEGENPEQGSSETPETGVQEGTEGKDNKPAEGDGESAPIEGENPEQGPSETPEDGKQESEGEGEPSQPTESEGQKEEVEPAQEEQEQEEVEVEFETSEGVKTLSLRPKDNHYHN